MRHIKIVTEDVPIGREATMEMPDDTAILASRDRGGHIKLVMAIPICGEETGKGTPCKRVVDTHDETCHDH